MITTILTVLVCYFAYLAFTFYKSESRAFRKYKNHSKITALLSEIETSSHRFPTIKDLDGTLAKEVIKDFHKDLIKTIKVKSNEQFFEEYIKKNSSPDVFILKYLIMRSEDSVGGDEIVQHLYPHYKLVRDFYLQIAQKKSQSSFVSDEDEDEDIIDNTELEPDLLGTITINEEEVSTCHLNNQQISFLANYNYLKLFEEFLSPVDNLRDLSSKRYHSGALLILIYHNIAPLVYSNLYSIQYRLSPIINPEGLNEFERDIFKLILLFPAIEPKALIAKEEILNGISQGKAWDFTSTSKSGLVRIEDFTNNKLRSVVLQTLSKFTNQINIEEEFLFDPDEVEALNDKLITKDFLKAVWPMVAEC